LSFQRVQLSKGLGLKVLAEGTESEEEVRYLVDRGCDLFQGYYFSRPVPSQEFGGLLDVASQFALPIRKAGIDVSPAGQVELAGSPL
jgi:EAL domain-containing protein (putative c-di-GMP-specific phosphodiesterase class I)